MMVTLSKTVQPAAVTVTPPAIEVTFDVDLTDLRTLLLVAGFPPDKIDLAQAVAMAESQGYSDAVGDLALIDAKWGPSIGLFQVRSLRSPQSFGGVDLWRYAWPLRDPVYNARAAWAITNGGDWSKWTGYTSGNYKQYLGGSPKIQTGHTNASNWWK